MFTAAGSGTGAELIRQVYLGQFVDALNNNDQLTGWFPPEQSPGDTAYRWKIHRGGNSSIETFSEGGPMAAAGNQTWASGAVTYLHFRGSVQITGHARAAMRSNWVSGLDEEMIQLKGNLVDLINRTYMDATNGIQVAISGTSDYAGVTRATSSWFCSYAQAVSDALGYSNMTTQYTTSRAFDYAAKPDVILLPWNQVKRYHAISGQPGMKVFTPTDVASGLQGGLTFAGIPIAALDDLTSTVALWLDRRPGKWAHVYHDTDTSVQGWEIQDLGKSGDSDVLALYYRGHLICRDPLRQSKMTSLTA